jgi:4a-hydroxytetrahydrobiopterin dehydratase
MERVGTQQEISDAVTGLGWRYVLGALHTAVRVCSLAQAANAAAQVLADCTRDVGERLSIDLRKDRLVLTVRLPGTVLAAGHIELARRISSVVRELGLATDAEVQHEAHRSVQALEIAIDALDIASIRPFWKAVLSYGDETDPAGPGDPLVDPLGQGPAIWFQQMDTPRPQRNRIHLDVSVPHDEAPRRIGAALAAGGKLVSDTSAPAFWVLSDAEGTEACVSTWQGRDG